MKDLLSIIIPIYDTNPVFFEKCLKSIIESVNIDKEIIVIDDGSIRLRSEEYKRLCNVYQADYFYQENQGVSSARNRGIDQAKGTFIMFVDADDRIKKADYLGWIHWMNKNNTDILSGCICKKFKDGSVEEKKIHADGLIFTYKNEDLIHLILTRDHHDHPELKNVEMAGPVCKLIRKTAINGLQFPEGIKIGEDMIFNLELLKRDINYVIVNELWYEYHINADSAMHRSSDRLEERYFDAIDRIANMNLTDEEEGYLAHRALYHYVRILKIYVLNGARIKEFIKFLNTMEHKKEWDRYWGKIRLRKCDLENKYKIALIFVKYDLILLLYGLIRISARKRREEDTR